MSTISGVGYLFATIAQNGFVIEPVFFWPDELADVHRDTIEPQILNRIDGFDKNLAAREAVSAMRAELVDLFCAVGGIHLQIAKSYKYQEGLRAGIATVGATTERCGRSPKSHEPAVAWV